MAIGAALFAANPRVGQGGGVYLSQISVGRNLKSSGMTGVSPAWHEEIQTSWTGSDRGYVTATCLNPKGIGSEDSEKLFEILGMSADDTEKKKTAKESAYPSVTKKVCDKYAFTNTAFFNYSIDEDQVGFVDFH